MVELESCRKLVECGIIRQPVPDSAICEVGGHAGLKPATAQRALETAARIIIEAGRDGSPFGPADEAEVVRAVEKAVPSSRRLAPVTLRRVRAIVKAMVIHLAEEIEWRSRMRRAAA